MLHIPINVNIELFFIFHTTAVECKKLKYLQLDHSMELSAEVAEQMCNFGLKSIENVEFTNTPISADAIRHFAGS